MTIDANAQSGILLTPIEKFQNVDSGAEAGFQLEVETLASAPPSDASGCVGQNGLGLVDLVHGRVGLVGLLVISVIAGRSEERRVGKGCVSTGRFRRLTSH